MQKITFFAVLTYLVCIASCSTFQSVKPDVSHSKIPSGCESLIPLIKKNWKKHKKLNYYKGEGEFLTIIQRDYRGCITSLTKSGLIALLGQPVKDDPDFAYYYLGETCVQPMRENCQALIFYFNDESKKVNEYLIHPFGVLDERE